MRAAKERKRQAAIGAGWEPEPRMIPLPTFEFGFRETARPGTECWLPFRGVRDFTRRIRVVRRFYKPGLPEASSIRP